MDKPFQIVSVILVIRSAGKYLLVKRSEKDDIYPGHWQNMGGKIEVGETVENAIKRELLEEVGLVYDYMPYFLHSYSWKKDEGSPTKLGLIFLLQFKGKPSGYKVTLSNELEDYGWFTLGEAKMLKTIAVHSPTGTIGQIVKSLNIL